MLPKRGHVVMSFWVLKEEYIHTHTHTYTLIYLFLLDMISSAWRTEDYIGVCPLKGHCRGKSKSDMTPFVMMACQSGS